MRLYALISALFGLIFFNFPTYAGLYNTLPPQFEIGYAAGAVDYQLFKNDIGDGVLSSSKSSIQFASRLHLNMMSNLNPTMSIGIEIGENYFSPASTQTNTRKRIFKQEWVTDILFNLKLQNDKYYIQGQSGMAFVPLDYHRINTRTNLISNSNKLIQWAVEYAVSLGWYMNDKINFDFAYRHITGDADSGMNIGANTIAMNSLLLGINYRF
jgi:hypothetical protein